MMALSYALMAVSFAGFWQAIRKKTGMNVYFIPFFTVTVQITVLFLAGLWNLLYAAAAVMGLLGIGLFIWYAVREHAKPLRDFCVPGYALLILGVLLTALAVRGCSFTNYDDFTHWALVVRQMLLNDRFPTFQDAVISYKSYPLGSASFIYYFCRFTQQTEPAQMLAQSYMILTCILALFAFFKRNAVWGLAVIGLLTNTILVYNVRITSLQVDTVLGTAGAVLLLYAALSFDPQDQQHLKGWSVLCAGPMMVAVLMLKNSGVLFVVLALAVLLIRSRHSRSQLIRTAWTALFPAAAMLLWKKHCAYVFVNAASSPHSMSMEYYKNAVQSKSPAEVSQILQVFLQKLTQANGLGPIMLLTAVLGLATLAFHRTYTKRWLTFSVSALGLYAAWMAGLLWTYLYSMSLQEALEAASFERYRDTILIVMLMLLTAYAVLLISRLKRPAALSITVVLASAAILAASIWQADGIDHIFCNQSARPESGALRFRFEQTIKDYDMQPGVRRIVCYPQNDMRHFFYLGRYLLGDDLTASLIVDEQNCHALEDGIDFEGPYENIVNYDPENPVLNQWIESHCPQQKGSELLVIDIPKDAE